MNLLDYVDWRGDLSFAVSPFNIIDALLFSQLVYLDFTGLLVKGRAKSLGNALKALYARTPKEKMNLGVIVPKEIVELGVRVQGAARYQSVRIHDYVKELDVTQKMQFAAFTVDLAPDHALVVYSGTDDSLIGWQENLNMIDTFPVAGESRALAYLEREAARHPAETISVCGHSKGGTLALYAGMYFSVTNRLGRVWNFDGPAFPPESFNRELFMGIYPIYRAVLPENSIIGKLFGVHGRHLIVASNAQGLYQHNAFSWQITGTRFVTEACFTEKSEEIAASITRILAEMPIEERKSFTENIYELICTSDQETLFEISRVKLKTFLGMRHLSHSSRSVLSELAKLFIKYGLVSRQEEHVNLA